MSVQNKLISWSVTIFLTTFPLILSSDTIKNNCPIISLIRNFNYFFLGILRNKLYWYVLQHIFQLDRLYYMHHTVLLQNSDMPGSSIRVSVSAVIHLVNMVKLMRQTVARFALQTVDRNVEAHGGILSTKQHLQRASER